MYEYGISHKHCGMRTVIFGYNFADACKRAKIDNTLWHIDYCDYID